jgi:hypothetical protein
MLKKTSLRILNFKIIITHEFFWQMKNNNLRENTFIHEIKIRIREGNIKNNKKYIFLKIIIFNQLKLH